MPDWWSVTKWACFPTCAEKVWSSVRVTSGLLLTSLTRAPLAWLHQEESSLFFFIFTVNEGTVLMRPLRAFQRTVSLFVVSWYAGLTVSLIYTGVCLSKLTVQSMQCHRWTPFTWEHGKSLHYSLTVIKRNSWHLSKIEKRIKHKPHLRERPFLLWVCHKLGETNWCCGPITRPRPQPRQSTSIHLAKVALIWPGEPAKKNTIRQSFSRLT